jgi:hypothetical protein
VAASQAPGSGIRTRQGVRVVAEAGDLDAESVQAHSSACQNAHDLLDLAGVLASADAADSDER